MTPTKKRNDRLYSNPQDLESVLELIKKVRPAGQLNDHPRAVDLHELLQSPLVQASTRLWLEDDNLIAYALVDECNNLLFDCSDPDLEMLGDGIVQWGMECLKSTDARSLDAGCRESDRARMAFLERHGFRKTPIETIFMERDLRQPLPEPLLPEGFSIRTVHGEGEAPALADLHRAAFGTDHVSAGTRLSWMRVPGYDPTLDLTALAPDGGFAAYCMCSISREEYRFPGKAEGRTDPIATHPRYQKLGLARALLLTGLQLLKQRGAETASLGTSSDNLPMQKAAASAGFIITGRKIWFEKEVN